MVVAAHKIWKRRRIFVKELRNIKNSIVKGYGALYKLCAPSIITHYALRITHCSCMFKF